jgi:DNA-binding LytR/AlgR family response regulator
MKAAQKAFEVHSLKQLSGQSREADHFFVKCDSKYEKLFYHEVLYIEALQNYAVIHTANRKLITYITMTGLENQLPKERFLKVHKSYIISIPHIKALEGHEILIGDVRIPISRTLKDEVMSQILGNKLFKR